MDSYDVGYAEEVEKDLTLRASVIHEGIGHAMVVYSYQGETDAKIVKPQCMHQRYSPIDAVEHQDSGEDGPNNGGSDEVSSSTTKTEVLSGELTHVSDELHCGLSRSLPHNELSKSVSRFWGRTSAGPVYVARRTVRRSRRLLACLNCGTMSDDQLGKEVRLGRAKRKSGQTSSQLSGREDRNLTDARCFFWLEPTFLGHLVALPQ